MTGGTSQAAVDLAVGGARPDVLAEMAVSAGWRAEDLDALTSAGLVVVDKGAVVRFVEDEGRELVLAAAPPAAVRSSHRRAAQACRSLHLPAVMIVEHLEQAALLADDDLAQELAAAAQQAEAEDDLRTATRAWQAAARLSTNAADRSARAVHGLGLVITNGLDYVDVAGLLDLLAGEQLSGECASWVEWLLALQRSDRDPDAAVTAQWSTIRRARDAAPETLRALLWDAAMNAWTLGDAPGGLRAAQDYAALPCSSPEDGRGVEPSWAGLALMSAGLFETGQVSEAVRLRSEAIDLAASADPHALPFDTLLSIVFLDDLLLDQSDLAGNRLHVALQRAPHESATAACLLGIAAWRARFRGDWAAADELLSQGRPLAAATGAMGAQLGMAALAVELSALRGRTPALGDESAWLREHASRKGDRRRLATLDHALGLHALAEGRLDEAIVRLGVAADAPFLGRGLRDGVLPARVDIVEAIARQGDREAADECARSVRAILVEMRNPLAEALACRVDGLVSTGDGAIAFYLEALERHGESNEVFERSRTLLLLAEAERRARRRNDARRHLVEAVAGFEHLDARPWLTRARSELRAVGGTVKAEETVASLTPQEEAVARAAASGLSTREVAEALFLSPRTVEFHLGNVYRKLGIHGRAALASRLDSVAGSA